MSDRIKIIDCEQGSPEWFAARLGIPTASEFATVMAKGRDGGESKTRKSYLYRLAGETLTGEPAETYSSPHMERGKVMEDEARDMYAFQTDREPARVGFIRNGFTGCSPDSLIGEDGLLEIKTKIPHLHIECAMRDGFPPEHKAQCQGALWITGRKWIDLAIYWPKLPLLIFRAERDEGYIANLAGAVKQFNIELTHVCEKMRRKNMSAEEASGKLMELLRA